MKVLLINASCGNGSTGRIVADLYAMLRAKGHTCMIAYGHGAPRMVPIENTIQVNNKFGYYIHNILGKLTDRAGFFSKHKTKKLIRYIKEYNPDLIHLHNLHGYWINIEILFKCLKDLNKPVIWTLHDCWAYTGHCSYYSVANCEKWKSYCHDCKFKSTYPKSFFIDNSKQNFILKKDLFTSLSKLQIVTPSNWLATEVKQSFLNKYPITAIPNGIDLKVFKPTAQSIRQKYCIPQDKIMLLAVSFVWKKEKGYNDLLDLNCKLDHNRYILVMVGLTKKQIELLPNDIIGIERTSNINELAELYSSADVFLNPSYQETMGMVTVEAIACGTPVVVYDKTAVPEFVEKSSGFIVEAGNIEAMLEKIELACKLPKENIAICAQKYERQKQYDTYYDLYLKSLRND